MAVRFAWTLATGCVAVLCGCESIAGIRDIALAPDASGDDNNANAQVEGGPEASADAFGLDAATEDDDASATDVVEGGLLAEAGEGGDAPVDQGDASLDGAVDATEDAAPDVVIDQTVDVGDVVVLTDGGGGDAEDATASDAIVAGDAAADSPAPIDASDAGDATVVKDAGDATVAMDAADAAAVGEGGFQLVLIDDQGGTSSGLGWLDGPNLKGTWYSYGDSLSTVKPVSDAGPAAIIGTMSRDGGVNTNAAHVTGTVGPSQTSSAGMGFNLISGTTGYDASNYAGIAFWARSGLDGGTSLGRFQVTSANTETYLTLYGFTYGEDLHLTTDWTEYVMLFNKLVPPNWYTGDAGPPNFTDQAALISCQFQFGESVTFDLWVDDVYFLVSQ